MIKIKAKADSSETIIKYDSHPIPCSGFGLNPWFRTQFVYSFTCIIDNIDTIIYYKCEREFHNNCHRLELMELILFIIDPLPST